MNATAVVGNRSTGISNLLMFHGPIIIPSPSITTISYYRHQNLARTSFSSAGSVYSSLIIDKTLESQTTTTDENPNSESISPRRRLILLRHAQSSSTYPSLRDHDRPLSEAGEADASKISHKLHQLGWIPELILCSDAVRTRETLKLMQDKVQEFLEAEVHFIPSFYSVSAMDGQTAEHLREAICKYSQDETLTVMCMGHNRGWEEAASILSGAFVELKTSNAALLEATGNSWEEAFSLAGVGGWKLRGIVKPNSSL